MRRETATTASNALNFFDEYNSQHPSLGGCCALWRDSDSYSASSLELMYTLLGNSWSCDIRLYPNGCPDPYWVKRRYEYALRASAGGTDPAFTLFNMKWQRPIRVLSWFLLVPTAAMLGWVYVLRNRAKGRTRVLKLTLHIKMHSMNLLICKPVS